MEKGKFLQFKPSFFAMGFQTGIDVRSVEVPEASFDVLGHFFPLLIGDLDTVFMFVEGAGLGTFPVIFGS
jgi:hypothetical protein